MSLIDRCPNLLDREVIGVVVPDELDHLGTVVNVDADSLSNLLRRVGIDVLVFPKVALARWDKARLAAIGRDDFARVDDRRAGEPPLIDSAPHIDHGVFGAVADIANGGKSGSDQN